MIHRREIEVFKWILVISMIVVFLLFNSRWLGQAWQSNMGAVTAVSASSVEQITEDATLTGIQARSLSRLDPSQAERWLSTAVADPDAPLTHFELCRFYWDNGRQTEAVKACQQVEGDGYYWLNLGLQADSATERDLKLAYFQMAANSDPDLAEAWFRLGRELVQQQDFLAAIPALEKANLLASEQTDEIYLLLGRAYVETDQVEKGRTLLQSGVALFPKNLGFYQTLARSYRQEDSWLEAEMWYGRWLEQDPDDATAWGRRGEAALKLDRPQDAMSYYQQATSLAPDHLGYWLGLAEAAAGVGNDGLVTEAYDKALEIEPDNISVLLAASRYYTNVNEIDKARKMLQHILQLDPNQPRAKQALENLP